jgi:hypothetical protein
MNFLGTMPGPEFLGVYLGWFALTWFGMLFVRHKVADTVWTTLGGWMCFEGLGIARFLIGRAHGMHNWEFLFGMMAIGTFFFLLRAEHLKGGSDGSWFSCGGGGCGGGGCGGGGCGGCGGS